MYREKTIVWRFDDLCFDKTSDFYIPVTTVKKIAAIFNKNNQKANFSFIVRPEDVYSKESKTCIDMLIQQGHQILAHGEPHVNWQKLNRQEIKHHVAAMRENLTALGITTNVFVFPGLKATTRAYPYLKKHGFTTILKGTRLKGLSRILDAYYACKYDLHFLPSHDWATHTRDWQLKPVTTFYSAMAQQNRFLHVMDHVWLYKNNSLKEFEEFINRTSSFTKCVTIPEFLEQK